MLLVADNMPPTSEFFPLIGQLKPTSTTLTCMDLFDDKSFNKTFCRRLGGVTVGTLDVRSKGREFDSRLGGYQVVTTRWVTGNHFGIQPTVNGNRRLSAVVGLFQ